jgi:GNAT superfamily N-acetyltransferase
VALLREVLAWVVEENGAILGHLSLRPIDAARSGPVWREALPVPAERLAVVSRFFVSRRARGRGVGSPLMTRAAPGRGVRP